MKTRFYWFILLIARFLVALLFPLRVVGAEHIPADGAAILCANHIANLDPVLMAVAARSRSIHYMAKAELFKFKPLIPIWRALGLIPVRRGESDMAALRTCISTLKSGEVVGIFAQGHRDKTGESAMESGVALLAMRTGTPVIPVFVAGPYRLFRRFPIIIGPPVDLSAHASERGSVQLKNATSTIESAVRALNPAISAHDG